MQVMGYKEKQENGLGKKNHLWHSRICNLEGDTGI
jgi:hypothetical protein